MTSSKSINKYLFFLVEIWTVFMSSGLVSWKSSVATPVSLSCVVFIAGKFC